MEKQYEAPLFEVIVLNRSVVTSSTDPVDMIPEVPAGAFFDERLDESHPVTTEP